MTYILRCEGKIGPYCHDFGQTCNQDNPAEAPCDFHCVAQCPDGKKRMPVEFEKNGTTITFQQCLEAEKLTKPMLVCDAGHGRPASFELQVPPIMKVHPFDDRNYSLTPAEPGKRIFEF